MFEWLRQIFRQSEDYERLRFFDKIDSLNAEGAGGKPTLNRTTLLGNL